MGAEGVTLRRRGKIMDALIAGPFVNQPADAISHKLEALVAATVRVAISQGDAAIPGKCIDGATVLGHIEPAVVPGHALDEESVWLSGKEPRYSKVRWSYSKIWDPSQ